jgi:hypothetical protein
MAPALELLKDFYWSLINMPCFLNPQQIREIQVEGLGLVEEIPIRFNEIEGLLE